MDNGRLFKEMKELQEATKQVSCVKYDLIGVIFIFCLFVQSKGPSVEAQLVGDNIRHWHGTIFGPVSQMKTLAFNQESERKLKLSFLVNDSNFSYQFS